MQEPQMLADVGHGSDNKDAAGFSLCKICQGTLDNRTSKSNGSCSLVLRIALLTLCCWPSMDAICHQRAKDAVEVKAEFDRISETGKLSS